MSESSRTRRLNEVATIIDSLHKTPAYIDSGYPMVRVTDVKGGFLDLSGTLRVSEDVFREFTRRHIPQRGDIVFSRVGTYGNASYVATDSKFCLGQNTAIISPHIPSRYLHFFLQSSFAKRQIEQAVVGSTQRTISLKSIGALQIPVPSEAKMLTIAHILGTLDDRIELNWRMNRTLEEIARAIFKSWFVDFDPVIDNAILNGKPIPDEFAERAARRAQLTHGESSPPENIRRLFPDEFQDSELGPIPKGWEVSYLINHITFALGGDWGKEASDERHTEPAYSIRGTDLPPLQQGQLPELRLRYLKQSSLEDRTLRAFDIVFEVSGGSPTQSTGRSLLINDALLNSYDHPLVCTNFCRLVRFSSEETALFVSFLLERLYSIDEFYAHETGTTTIKNFAFKRFVEDFEIVFPDRQILSAFAQTIRSSLASHSQNGVQSDLLSKIRDTLLPPLLSGRIAGPCDGTQGEKE